MIGKLLSRILYGKPLKSNPCEVCDAPSFDGVCPNCFDAGRKWKHGKK